MYSPKTVDSFDYLYSMDRRILEEGYYDSGKNVLMFEDKEYPPEQAENPEHYTGENIWELLCLRSWIRIQEVAFIWSSRRWNMKSVSLLMRYTPQKD